MSEEDIKGWLTALFLLLGLLALPTYMACIGDRPLSGDQIEPLGDAVGVAIAMCVGYLTLDRFRAHKRLNNLVKDLLLDVPLERLIRTFKDGSIVAHHKPIMALLYLTHQKDAVAATVGTEQRQRIFKTDFYQSWRGNALWWLLKARADRKVVILILVGLCLWQFIAAAVELRPSIGLDLDARCTWIVFVLACLGFVVPALSWLLTERTVRNVTKSSDEWRTEKADTLKRVVDDLDPSTLDSAPPTGANRAA